MEEAKKPKWGKAQIKPYSGLVPKLKELRDALVAQMEGVQEEMCKTPSVAKKEGVVPSPGQDA